MRLIFASFLLVFMHVCSLYSQCTSLLQPSFSCEEAELFCFAGNCYESSDSSFACCNGWCGVNTAIHNPQYFAFIASSAHIEIQIHVNTCNSGFGLQSAILDACPWDNMNILDCDPGTPPGGTMMLTTDQAIPGEMYWVVIDGSSGATCEYTLSDVQGVEQPALVDTLDPVLTYSSETVVCPGYSDLQFFTGPDAVSTAYLWTLMWSGETEITLEPTLTIDIPTDISEEHHMVCVQQINGCDSSEAICIPFLVQSTPPAEKDTAIFCAGSFPITWHAMVIDSAGTYTQSFFDLHSCSFDSIWTVEAYPVQSPGILDTFVCNSIFEFNGNTYDESGTYIINLGFQDVFGCDSSLTLNLQLGAPEVFVSVECENNSQDALQVNIVSMDESIDTVIYLWYDCTYTSLLAEGESFIPDTAGCYSLIKQSGTCADTISAHYRLNVCEQPCVFDIAPACADVQTQIISPILATGGMEANWEIGNGFTSIFFSGNDTLDLTIPAAVNLSIAVTVTQNDTTQTCFSFINVFEGPRLSLCCDTIICDSCTLISLNNFNGVPGVANLSDGQIIGLTGESQEIQVCPPLGEIIDFSIISSVDAHGCTGTVSGDSAVSVGIKPSLVFIVVIADTLYAYPSDAGNLTWSDCETGSFLSSDISYAPTSSGCYCLETVNEFGCSYQECIDFIHSGVTYLPDDILSIFPNPSNGKFDITIEGEFTFPIKWECMDVCGRNLANGTLQSGQSGVDVDHLVAGNYFLKFDLGEKGFFVKRVVIE